MKIDFERIREISLPHFNGGEGETALKTFSDRSVTVLTGRLEPGDSVGLHTHLTDCEVIYVISGTGKAIGKRRAGARCARIGALLPQGEQSLFDQRRKRTARLFLAVVPSV